MCVKTMVRVLAFEAFYKNWKKDKKKKKKRWRDVEGKRQERCVPSTWHTCTCYHVSECRHDKHDARVGEGGEHRPEEKKEGW